MVTYNITDLHEAYMVTYNITDRSLHGDIHIIDRSLHGDI